MQNNSATHMLKIINILLRISPALFWILLIFAFDAPHIGVLTVICAIIHELGHILASLYLSSELSLRAAFSGLRLYGERHLSYKEEMLIAASGPLANILLFAVLILTARASDYMSAFAILNLLTAFSNLLPIKGYDGYRIAECSLSLFSSPENVFRILRHLSFGITILFAFFSLYLMARLDGGYWIYFVFLFMLLESIIDGRTVKSEKKRGKRRF